jgi:hypothetical protein
MKIMPRDPTFAMMEAMETALSNCTVKNPKATAWDALTAYRAAWHVAPDIKPTGETNGTS